eukprot:1977300-Rhodomonas_salina.8
MQLMALRVRLQHRHMLVHHTARTTRHFSSDSPGNKGLGSRALTSTVDMGQFLGAIGKLTCRRAGSGPPTPRLRAQRKRRLSRASPSRSPVQDTASHTCAVANRFLPGRPARGMRIPTDLGAVGGEELSGAGHVACGGREQHDLVPVAGVLELLLDALCFAGCRFERIDLRHCQCQHRPQSWDHRQQKRKQTFAAVSASFEISVASKVPMSTTTALFSPNPSSSRARLLQSIWLCCKVGSTSLRWRGGKCKLTSAGR